jgi:hypothetical protein
MGSRIQINSSALVVMLAYLGCATTRRLAVVADSVAQHYTATEVSATMRSEQDLIVALTNPDSAELMGGRDRSAVGDLAHLAYVSYGDREAVRSVRVRLLSTSGAAGVRVTRVLLDTLLFRWQLE